MDFKVESLFPQPVAIYKLDRNLNTKELSFIKKQKTCPNVGNKTSANNKILDTKELVDLRSFIEDCVSSYLNVVYDPKNNIKLRITQSWCNYTESGGFHHKHEHPNSFISGVFYPQADKEVDKIYFYRSGFQQFQFPTNNWNLWNSSSWWFEVNTGDLVLFPSSLTHSVEPVKGDRTRISLSFNTFPVGNLGEMSTLSALDL